MLFDLDPADAGDSQGGEQRVDAYGESLAKR